MASFRPESKSTVQRRRGLHVRGRLLALLALLVFASMAALAACGNASGTTGTGGGGDANTNSASDGDGNPSSAPTLVVYSGRNENLVDPLIQQFSEQTGINVNVRYGNTAELTAALLEEGERSPAHIFFAQDAGGLGALARENLFRPLPENLLAAVDEKFRSPDGLWVGLSGRVRTVIYNTDNLTEEQLPDNVFGFTDESWRGRIGWAPTNASFQTFVTALRAIHGEDAAREWLQGILNNQPRVYPNNMQIVEAVAAGEIDAGFVNHYYLHRFKAERGDGVPAANYLPRSGDVGALVNVAGVGILTGSQKDADQEAAEQFVAFMLSEPAQRYFAEQTYEYPLAAGVEPAEGVPPLDQFSVPDIDLTNLWDMEHTLELLRNVGAL